jgi:hypothetical protein
MDMKQLEEQFKREYTFLYDHSNVPGYGEAVAAFDRFVKTNGDIVGQFCRHRGDFIASDREAAAFMFALEAMSKH